MTDSPLYATPPFGVAQPRTSGASITSLVLGILLCIPATSIVAIVFAVVGLKATRNRTVRGRGLAIAGLVLGIIGVVGWAGVGLFVWFLVAGSAAPRAALHDFVGNVASGNLAAASAQCEPSVIPTSAIGTLHGAMAPYGTYVDLTSSSVNLRAEPGGEVCELRGTIQFTLGVHSFNSTLQKDLSGAWKVWGFHIY
jgi:hypothetical protein